MTELHKAVFNNDLELIQKLLEEEGSIYLKDDRDQTPLHIAGWLGNRETTELLIERGADIEAKDRCV